MNSQRLANTNNYISGPNKYFYPSTKGIYLKRNEFNKLRSCWPCTNFAL